MLNIEKTASFKVTLTEFQGRYLLIIDTLPAPHTSGVVLRVATNVYDNEEDARTAYNLITYAALATAPNTWAEPVTAQGQVTPAQAEAAVQNYLDSLKQPDE
jgi:hypothetical protein